MYIYFKYLYHNNNSNFAKTSTSNITHENKSIIHSPFLNSRKEENGELFSLQRAGSFGKIETTLYLKEREMIQ